MNTKAIALSIIIAVISSILTAILVDQIHKNGIYEFSKK